MSEFETALKVMNEAFAADPAAVHALIVNRVPCNDALADHPNIPVEGNIVTSQEHTVIGALGLINGVLDAMFGRKIAAIWNDDDKPKFMGFAEWKAR